jgi:hypothetical protein
MAAFDDKQLATFVADETAWHQFADAHTTDRLQILSAIAERGAEAAMRGCGVWTLKTVIGNHDLGVYGSLEEARAALQPGGKWHPGV